MEPYRNYSRNGFSRNTSSCNSQQRVPANQCSKPTAPPNMTVPLAMAFVHMQEWRTLYSPDDALCNGTAFPELNLIFCGVRGK